MGKAGENKDATVVVAAGEYDNEGNPSTFKTVRKFIQKSTIWRVLNYGMNYDIHKVRVHEV